MKIFGTVEFESFSHRNIILGCEIRTVDLKTSDVHLCIRSPMLTIIVPGLG